MYDTRTAKQVGSGNVTDSWISYKMTPFTPQYVKCLIQKMSDFSMTLNFDLENPNVNHLYSVPDDISWTSRYQIHSGVQKMLFDFSVTSTFDLESPEVSHLKQMSEDMSEETF